jgi:hypothetical protein
MRADPCELQPCKASRCACVGASLPRLYREGSCPKVDYDAADCCTQSCRYRVQKLSAQALDSGVLDTALSSWLGKALIKCFADQSEQARIIAVSTFYSGLQRYPDAAMPMLPYLMPVLVERLQLDPVSKQWREPVEELRLQMFTVSPAQLRVPTSTERHFTCHDTMCHRRATSC